MSSEQPHSLSRRLLWLLFGAIVLVACAEFLVSYRSALSEADEIFDYHMQQIAIALRPGLSISPPDHLRDRRKNEADGDFLIQIWTADGVQILEPDDRLALPQLAVVGFSNIKARGTTFRVFSVQTASQIIQIAQDMAVRRRIAEKLALRTAAPIALMAPILMLLVSWVVNRSFQPLARVRRQVSERQVSDLSPVNDAGLPEEIKPLVGELNHLLERVKEAFEAQQHFVSDAAHELRSPLAALKLQVQGLRRAVDNETRETAVERLSSGIDRATHLVTQLLILARQEASTGTGEKPEFVSLSEICRLALEDMLGAARERSIDMGIGHADEIGIEGYPESLRILVRNLLDNAIKYSPEGGRIDLEIRAVNGAAELMVDDSGPGIDVEHRERVFDRFYRINDTQKTGSGLGLAIAKSVADRHHADLNLAHSTRLGGLRVIVRFPALGRA